MKSLAFVFTLLIFSYQALAEIPVASVVVKAGDPAPGTSVGTIFSSFPNAKLNDQGKVLFSAWADGKRGTWVGFPGAFELVALPGEQAPDLATGVQFNRVVQVDEFDQQGKLFVSATLTGPGITTDNDAGIWVGRPGELELVMREGDLAPGLGPNVFIDLAPLRVSYSTTGKLAFIARLRGDGITADNDFAIFEYATGQLTPIAVDGDQPPGLPTGSSYYFGISSLLSSTYNSFGEFAFANFYSEPGANNGGRRGVWMGETDNLQFVLDHGQPAPETEPGTVIYGSFREMRLNDSGELTFATGLFGPSITFANNSAVYHGKPDDLRLVIRKGDALPGGMEMETINLGTFPAGYENSNGYFSFDTAVMSIEGPSVTDASDRAILFGPVGDIKLVAREGSAAPDLPDGRPILHIQRDTTFNSLNDLAFIARLNNLDGTPSGPTHLWVRMGGETKRVVGRGDYLMLDTGEIKLVRSVTRSSFSYPLTEGGFAYDLNNNRQLIFEASLDNFQHHILMLSFDLDEDNDDIPDTEDDCPETKEGAVINSQGCSLAQLCPCAGPFGTGENWRNHGKYVSCLSKTSKGFVRDGLLGKLQRSEIVSAAAASACGK